MLPGFSGELISEYFAEQVLPTEFAGHLGEASRDAALRRLLRWWRVAGATLGPASSLRAVFDLVAVPLFEALGFAPTHPRVEASGRVLAADLGGDGAPIPLLVVSWGAPLDRAWTDIARLGLRLDAPWGLSFNGREVRLSDCQRTHARRHTGFDIEQCLGDPGSFGALWGVLRAEAFLSPADEAAGRQAAPLIDRIVLESARQSVRVCGRLREGVVEALTWLLRGMAGRLPGLLPDRRTQRRLAWTYEQAITVVYRILFLLFAESRGLVPVWHPHYRDGYTIAALCAIAEAPGEATGLWDALQAISRLAHAGCDAGTLRVTPFNGRLFAPERARLAESRRVDDEAVRRTILALATQPGRGGRARVAFRDLDVEQLGAVYESVLDYEPDVERCHDTGRRTRPGGGQAALRIGLRGRGDRRKSSGTFYTPRAITDFLVRRTLAPLVQDLSPDAVLRLRVLDPAMGSGAFLVAACRYLGGAYENALVASGACHVTDIGLEERAAFRRLVAQRCLFGVDLNPMAVQVARLSLWLTSLAAEKPLTFLDHHLVAGDSLVGASIEDLSRAPSRTERPRGAGSSLPLFDADALGASLADVMPVRSRLAAPDETVAAVREKEQMLATLAGSSSALARWADAADLWCARWFWDAASGVPAPSAREAAGLIGGLLGSRTSLPPHVAGPRLDIAREVARSRRFFHWTLEFPEVFFDQAGAPRADAGFDAVIGNPPWDVIRADGPSPDLPVDRRREVRQMVRFARESGIYPACREGHPNRYQLFLERSVRLLRRGGRLGVVVPWGLASDQRSAGLRRLLFERCETDALVSFENSAGIFPIHRGIRFMLVTAASGGSTTAVRCLLGATDAAVLENLPDAGHGRDRDREFPVTIRTDLLRRLGGPGLAIPHVRSSADLALLERMASLHAPLASPRGWGTRFGRELNATDDRRLFRTRGLLPVLEGKHIEPFVARVDRASRFVASPAHLPSAAMRAEVGRARLAYRDVASASNRLTLIAAVVPAGAVTVHTVFCLKSPLDADEQAFLCGVLNSFTANCLARLRITTHVGAGIGAVLPVPRPARGSAPFEAIAALSRRLAASGESDQEAYCRLQGVVARAYGLTPDEYRLVLESFPLAGREVLDGSWKAFVEPANF